MFENYFRIGWRNLACHKIYSSIKIGGFAVGIAACLLISLFITQELSYDRHYADGDRIYRVLRQSVRKGEQSIGIHLPAPFVSVMREEYADVEKAGHYMEGTNFGAGNNEVRRVDKSENTHEEGFVFMDQGLLDILEVPFVSGNRDRALTDPKTIVITERKARQYFPYEDPLGKILILNNDEQRQYTITGVIKDFPVTSHLKFDFIMTLSGHELWPGEQTDWTAGNYIDYVKVTPGTDITQLEKKMSAVLEKYYLPATIEGGGTPDAVSWVKSIQFKLQPVSSVYMNRESVRDGLRHGDIRYVWLFGAIAVMILVIACINFINLSTAKSANRAKEVGLRKVVGSARTSLIKQFLVESLLYSYFSFALAVVIAATLLPYFNEVLAKQLSFPWRQDWFISSFLATPFLIAIIAGLYPSFYLSSFRPAQVLKGNLSLGSKNPLTRNVLVVFQFSVSIILICGTFAIHRQMNYILTKKVGFDKDQVIVLEGTHTLKENLGSFKTELQRLSNVRHVSVTSYIPIEGAKRNGGPCWLEGMVPDEGVGTQFWSVDPDYIQTMGLKVLKGRDFSPLLASDSQAAIVNEALVRALHLQHPLGTTIKKYGGDFTIVGVIGDFHFESLRQNIEPLMLQLDNSVNSVLVKANSTDMSATISAISTVWKKFSPNQPIRFTFLDQGYAKMYDDVKRMEVIFTTFAVLAIIVACLGLFALSAFMIEQRGKEISIRLVLGASLKNIFTLLTSNFMKLVLIAFVIAVPCAYYLIREWLSDFAYKIEFGWETFAFAGIAAIVIALATISYQSLKAALTNPVQNLKSE